MRQHHAEVCELIEGFLPEDEKAMPAVIAVKVNDIYLALSRAMDLPPAASWLDEQNYFSVHALVAAAPVKAVRSDGGPGI